jgi:hypothetical protein
MRKNNARIRQTAAHIPGIFGLLSEPPRHVLHHKGDFAPAIGIRFLLRR